MRLHRAHGVFVLFLISLAAYGVEEADIILRNGKIITVDDRFTSDELDAVAPNNPVALQLIYFRIYTNTAGLKTLGIDANTSNPPGGIIVKDANGQPTGVLNGGGAVRATLAKLGDIAMARMA